MNFYFRNMLLTWKVHSQKAEFLEEKKWDELELSKLI